MKNTSEQKLFELAHHIGEFLNEKIHIIDNTDNNSVNSYRIYHNEGYCWDITKKSTEGINYSHVFMEEWDGFKRVSCIEEVITKISLAVDYNNTKYK